ncbi:MAG: hypothetical protein R3C03_04680 [Pirellulaceae bacterium]
MKHRWIGVLALGLVVACNSPTTEQKSAETKSADNSTSVTAPADEKPGAEEKSESAEATEQDDDKGPANAASNDKAEDESKALVKRVENAVDEFMTARREFSTAMRAAKTDEERQAAQQKYNVNPNDVAQLVVDSIDKLPDADLKRYLVWVVQNTGDSAHSQKAKEVMLNRFVDSQEMTTILSLLSRMASKENEEYLSAVKDKAESDSTKASVVFTLVNMLKSKADMKETLDNNPQFIDSIVKSRGQEYLDYVNDVPGEETIVALLDEVINDYPDATDAGGNSLKSQAELIRFEMLNLAIGKTAPEIEGSDFEEVAFKLSDYRGKVVVLDFWGDW